MSDMMLMGIEPSVYVHMFIDGHGAFSIYAWVQEYNLHSSALQVLSEAYRGRIFLPLYHHDTDLPVCDSMSLKNLYIKSIKARERDFGLVHS